MAKHDAAMREAYVQLNASVDCSVTTLSENLVEQSQLFGHVAGWYALAIKYRDQIKKALGEVEAQIKLEVRDRLDSDGKKYTVDVVQAHITLNPLYSQAHDRLIDAEKIVNDWDGLRESYRQRGYSMKELAYIHGAGDYVDERMASERERHRRMRQ
jgi:hypothetical protein